MSEYITIDGFDTLSKQEIFDTCVDHMAAVKRPSLSRKTCAYTGPGCNVAPFIKRENRREADILGVWESMVELDKVPTHECDMMVRLQTIHDDSAVLYNTLNPHPFLEAWREDMLVLASEYGLDTGKLEKVKL